MLHSDLVAALQHGFTHLASDSTLLDRIAAAGTLLKLDQGQGICEEGDSCQSLALVVSGSARVFKLAESGREITLYRVDPGECCILTASCILSDRRFPATAIAETRLHAVVIPQQRVFDWMQQHAVWRAFLWRLIADRLGDVISLVEEIAFRRVDRRLADYLCTRGRCADSYIKATHNEIAADLGTSREVISRLLKDFESRGLLHLGRGLIQLEQTELANYLSTL